MIMKSQNWYFMREERAHSSGELASDCFQALSKLAEAERASVYFLKSGMSSSYELINEKTSK